MKLEDFELLEGETMVANLAEAGSAGASYLVILDPTGKKIDSIGKTLFSDYPDLENRAFLEIKDGKLYVGYKYQPLFEVYEVKNRQLLRTFPINASIFPSLLALIQDKSFANPAPGVFKMPKFIAAFKVVSDRLYALLHTPNPVIVELTPEGKEIQRYISNETEAVDYFGFDVRTKNDTKQFFVGNVDRLGDSSIAVYEVDQ